MTSRLQSGSTKNKLRRRQRIRRKIVLPHRLNAFAKSSSAWMARLYCSALGLRAEGICWCACVRAFACWMYVIGEVDARELGERLCCLSGIEMKRNSRPLSYTLIFTQGRISATNTHLYNTKIANAFRHDDHPICPKFELPMETLERFSSMAFRSNFRVAFLPRS